MTVSSIYDPGEGLADLIHAVWTCTVCGASVRHDGPLAYDPEDWATPMTKRTPD